MIIYKRFTDPETAVDELESLGFTLESIWVFPKNLPENYPLRIKGLNKGQPLECAVLLGGDIFYSRNGKNKVINYYHELLSKHFRSNGNYKP